MKILVTGAKGFVGRNLTENLKNIRDGKRTDTGVRIEDVFEYDLDCSWMELESFCKDADFVFNLAGVNRTENSGDFMKGNFGFVADLLELLEKHENRCPVMYSSSIQACCSGRYELSEYGKSKRAAEEIIFSYGIKNSIPVYVYRFPNIFGKWCKPNYNSVVATFCNNIANDLPIKIDDRGNEIELLYIDDLVEHMIDLLKGNFLKCDYSGTTAIVSEEGPFCYVPVTRKITLGELADTLYSYHDTTDTVMVPALPQESFEKKLYSTYLSYLPKEKCMFSLEGSSDERGSFYELLKTSQNGQVSINITKPGMTRGQHWHNTKAELFIVISGRGLIRERRIGSDEIIEREVSGRKIEAVYMLPGYTHSLVNLSENEDLITIIWANEVFDPNDPDTFFEKV